MSQGGLDKQAATVKICLACNREFREQITLCPHDGTSLIALKNEDEFLEKTLSNTYYVTEKVGQGGMGVVYKANHQMLDRIVAIKMLQAELTQDELSVKRFQQEAKAASCLSHPHIITLYDFGILPTGQPFLVMEYLQGVPLLDEIKTRGPLDPLRAVKIFSEVADGLYHAHTQGIVHRDLKPSNIILVERDQDRDFVKIVDFGLAKLMPWSGKESQHLTKTGEVFGSPIYMSPEQCMGKALGPTSDIYSLGITLFEALVGKPPFRGSNSIQTASKHMSDPPPRFQEMNPAISLPENLERVVLKTLQKQPEDRFQNMAEFKDALQAAVYNDAAIEIPPSLLVSRAAVPALNSSSGISAIKSSASISAIKSSAAVPALRGGSSDQSETRMLSSQYSAQQRPGGGGMGKPLLIGGIAAAVLAIGGALAYFSLGGASHELRAEGTLWYFNRFDNPPQLIVHSSNGPVTLQIPNSDAVKDLPERESDSPLGKVVKARFKGRSATAVEGMLQDLILDPQPTTESKALDTVREFMSRMCGADSEDMNQAREGFTDNLPEDTFKAQFTGIPKRRKGSGEPEAPKVRPVWTERIYDNKPEGIVIDVDKQQFLDNGQIGWWRFTVGKVQKKDGEKMLITSVEEVQPPP